MTENNNQNPELKARDNIDRMSVEAGWVVYLKRKEDFSAAKGFAVRGYHIDVADYRLFAIKKPVDWEPEGKLSERIKIVEKVKTKNVNHAG